jgi:hypothetical protein
MHGESIGRSMLEQRRERGDHLVIHLWQAAFRNIQHEVLKARQDVRRKFGEALESQATPTCVQQPPES